MQPRQISNRVKHSSGFTFLESVVVIFIIMLLLSIAIPGILNYKSPPGKPDPATVVLPAGKTGSNTSKSEI